MSCNIWECHSGTERRKRESPLGYSERCSAQKNLLDQRVLKVWSGNLWNRSLSAAEHRYWMMEVEGGGSDGMLVGGEGLNTWLCRSTI